MSNPDIVNYSEDFSASDQIDAEEWIAAYLFDTYREGFNEHDARDAGQDILQEMIQRFRPDLTEEGQIDIEMARKAMEEDDVMEATEFFFRLKVAEMIRSRASDEGRHVGLEDIADEYDYSEGWLEMAEEVEDPDGWSSAEDVREIHENYVDTNS